MPMLLPTHAEYATWKDIQRIAVSLSQRLQEARNPPKSFPTFTSSTLPTIPSLELPFPSDILSPVLTLDVTPHLRDSFYQAFTRRIRQLQQEYAKFYNRTCLAIPPTKNSIAAFESLRKAYEALYQRQCLPMIQAQVTSLLAEMGKRRERHIAERKPIFNNQFVPLLENYFDVNAYPSAAERLDLARRSKMTARQIEVWFQNHRNRAKKEGKGLKRWTSSHPISLDSLTNKPPLQQSHTPSSSLSSGRGHPGNEDAGSIIDGARIANFACLDAPRPSHAFPTPFRLHGAHNPFPSENGKFKFPPLVWRRKPSQRSHVHDLQIVDMAGLTGAFRLKLQIRDGTRKLPEKLALTRSPSPWYAATVTHPPPAPLPALIRGPPSVLHLKNTLSHSTIFGSISLTPCVPPPCIQPRMWRSRKSPPFPRRVPSERPYPFRQELIASLPSSRTSSLSSVNSSESRSSSASSQSSLPPSTPTISPVQHPNEMGFINPSFNDALDAIWTVSSDALLGYHPMLDLDFSAIDFESKFPFFHPPTAFEHSSFVHSAITPSVLTHIQVSS